MLGIALEGGGARGAYHVGAIKAFTENGYKIDMIAGTSIGALNAAMIVQGDIDKLYDLWANINFSDIFDLEDRKMRDIFSANIGFDTIKYMSMKVKDALKNKGMDTQKIRAFIERNVDEERVRKSDIRFGLVTFNLSDIKGEELFIEDIPEGKLVDYLMATSSLPVFKRAKIEDKKYLDGGSYDNCPVEMLAKAGCNEVYAIRTYKRNRIRNYSKILKMDDLDLKMVEPVDSLVNILNFDNKALKEVIYMGYYDTLKSIKKLDGYRYYINPKEEEFYFNLILNIKENNIKKIIEFLDIKCEENTNIRKVFLEEVIPLLTNKILKNTINNYKDFILQLTEYIAINEGVKRYQIYDVEDFLEVTKKKIRLANKSKLDKAAYKLIKSLEI